MLPSWRWFGPSDPVGLDAACQSGATGIVTALHELPNGVVWPKEFIQDRQQLIESFNPQSPLRWAVVESVPVHEAIKTGAPDRDRYVEAYRETLRNIGACGIEVVCYNFMPVVDWTRTDLRHRLPDGSKALRLDRVALAAFDQFILGRPGAEDDYEEQVNRAARDHYQKLSRSAEDLLTRTILAGLPGSEESYTLGTFRQALEPYRDVDAEALRSNLIEFIKQIAPVAAEAGVRLAIHPDDPPYSILGLPRVVSTGEDLEAVLAASDLPENGLTFCTGSLGARADNDPTSMVMSLREHIHFAHLRNVRREETGGFVESDHLDGDVDMIAVVSGLVAEEGRRRRDGRSDHIIPMRPDHGHQMLGDRSVETNPGYWAIGRLRGLAELRGVEEALRRRMADLPV
ncbi:MAG: mannonate dehydratase [Bacteroidota bacterium]